MLVEILIITIFLIAIILAFVSHLPKQNRSNVILFGIILILIATFRDGADRDYYNYVAYYDSIQIGDIFIEPTFWLISLLVRVILFDNVIFLFLIYAILGVGLKMMAIKELTNLWLLSIAIYISFYYILQDLTQIRSGVATGIFLLSLKPLYERKLKLYIVHCTIAAAFHYSAILLFPLVFLRGQKMNIWLYATLIPASYSLYFLGISFYEILAYIPIDFIQQKVILYIRLAGISDGETLNVFSNLQLMRCSICFFILWKKDLIHEHNRYVLLLIKIYIISIALFVLFVDIPVFAFRASELLGIVEIIVVPLLIYAFASSRLRLVFPMIVGAFLIYIQLFYIGLLAN